ncbi:MAG: Holliday junction branch migration protein RuvA [Clostridia bacterium]|nr:Holliday junction branch migration protein RuvA [Clostridia bacterium]
MIYSLNGTLTAAGPLYAVIECGGVGFKCSTTANTLRRLPKIGESAMLYTHLNVREDALDLYGFFDQKELSCFKMLISVSGVGPKAALSILSEATPEKFALYAASGDVKALTRAPGVGTKIAQRIILELRDKISGAQAAEGFSQADTGIISASGNVEEAINALMVLGYSRSDAAMAAARCDESLSIEEIIRQALKNLSK